MSKNMAEETVNLIADGFNSQTDPYGKKWKDKKKPDGRKTLSGKTGDLKTGWHPVEVTEGGFTVAPSVDYAAPHQSPRDGKRPRRMMIPDKKKGLPTKWKEVYGEIATETLKAHFARSSAGSMGFVTAKLVGLKRRFSADALLRKMIRFIAEG